MKRKIILSLLIASMFSLTACGKDSIGSLDGDAPEVTSSDSAEISSADGETEPTVQSSEVSSEISSDIADTTANDVESSIEDTSTSDGNEILNVDSQPDEAYNSEFNASYSDYTDTDGSSGYVAGSGEYDTPPQNDNSVFSAPSYTEGSPVVEYGSTSAAAGTYAATHGDSPNAPSPSDYNYGPAPVMYDIEGIKYIDGMLVANKTYSLPEYFNPGLDDTCYAQFEKLCEGAAADGLNIYLSSGFRSYEYQDEIYNNYVYWDGQENADRYSARPGHSEHQSGLAIDVNIIDDSFAGTPEAEWIEAHCHEYGFILRYPKGKEDITGYKYESWHIRYVGTDLSYKIAESGLTVEEFFGIDSYYH